MTGYPLNVHSSLQEELWTSVVTVTVVRFKEHEVLKNTTLYNWKRSKDYSLSQVSLNHTSRNGFRD